MAHRFLRQDTSLFFKLGRGRRKLQKWRKPKGRHSKMRQKRKSYPASPSIGYRTDTEERAKINNLYPLMIENMSDLKKANKDSILVLSSRLGSKKKLEIIKKAEEKKIKILNVGGQDEPK